MELKTTLNQIQEKQISTFQLITDFRNSKGNDILSTKRRGLYWIWSNLTVEQLEKIETKPNSKEVPISELVSRRKKLNGICHISINNYKIVYNGIGGYKKIPANFGLRERINQEINCSNKNTGTLNLQKRFNENNKAENWGISFFDFDNSDNIKILNQLKYNSNLYLEFSKIIETDWRIEFGTPILTRH